MKVVRCPHAESVRALGEAFGGYASEVLGSPEARESLPQHLGLITIAYCALCDCTGVHVWEPKGGSREQTVRALRAAEESIDALGGSSNNGNQETDDQKTGKPVN